MIELDSALIIILIEVAVTLLLILAVLFFFNSKKKGQEGQAASAFIDQLESNELARSKQLEALITKHCQIAPDDLRKILQNIRQGENALYHRVLELFLKKEPSDLSNVSQQMDALSNSYCQIFQANQGDSSSMSQADLDIVNEKLAQLQHENSMLAQQLQTAMHTMDEISSEYTKVFSGTQNELELENSRKKMVATFLQTEKNFSSPAILSQEMGDHL